MGGEFSVQSWLAIIGLEFFFWGPPLTNCHCNPQVLHGKTGNARNELGEAAELSFECADNDTAERMQESRALPLRNLGYCHGG